MHYILRRVFFCFLSLALVDGTIASGWVQGMRRDISASVLRLHIVANSDSGFDQTVKLQVRDRILTDCGFLFAGSPSAAESAARAREYAGVIRQTAQAELRRQGFLYPVSVQVGDCRFPTKDYGGVRLPAGCYTAVNIKIGAAAGRNWWCVMYPPLCLTGGSVKADEETLSLLQKELTAEEYALITETEEVNVKMKFKLAEMLGKYIGGR